MSKPRGGHVLATVFFTDIVDSSRLATELGDRRWRVLLARHHAIVRRALRRYRGKEIDNAGDGFFASFDDQVDAIRCACAISDGVRTLGIEVRAGLHVGQAEAVGKKLGGVVVHAGARVMSEARPGEVLVSSVLKELVPGSGFTFADRGTRRLKGIDGDWDLFAVTAVDGTVRPDLADPTEAAHIRESIEAPPLIERRSGRVGILVFGVFLTIVVAFLVLHRPEPPHAVQVLPNSLVKIDTKTNAIVSDVPVAAPGLAQLTAVPPDEIWVLSREKQVISIVNTTTGEVTPLGAFVGETAEHTGSLGIVYGFGGVWVTGGHNELVEFSPNRTVFCHRTIPSLTIPGYWAFLAQGYGRVWVTVHDGERVIAIDPGGCGEVESKKILVAGVGGIAVGEAAVWVSGYGNGTIAKIDPRSLETERFQLGIRKPSTSGGGDTYFEPGGLGAVTTAFGSVWSSDVKNGVVYRIDPATRKTQATIPVGEPSLAQWGDIVAADGSVWVVSPKSKTIVRIDPKTDAVAAAIPVPYTPAGLASSDGAIWATVNS
jgi:class 3 adenylate cyclase/streptogramin lyase